MDLLPQFDSCWFFSLETAAKIIGLIEVTFYGGLFLATYIYTFVKRIQETNNLLTLAYVFTATYFERLGTLLAAFFGGFLILGVRNKSPELVLSWIFLNISSIIVLTISLIYMLIPEFTTARLDVLHILEALVLETLNIVFLFVVVNYYRSIAKGNLVEDEAEIIERDELQNISW